MIVFFYACEPSPAKNDSEAKAGDTLKVAEETRTSMSFLNDYNALEAVFGNENWMLVDNKDTAYYYFSRLNNLDFNTYQYKMVKGDSADVRHDKIKPEKNNLRWNFDGKELSITSATIARIDAAAQSPDSAAKYVFTRLDRNNIGITYPNQKKAILKRTIPFSLFLVRSRYDYTNGTRFAFDTAVYTKK